MEGANERAPTNTGGLMNSALNINNYVTDGFVRVCRVVLMTDDSWRYKEINKDIMFSEHSSWVYFIVVDNEIVKVGETGNPLGIRSSRFVPEWGYQPKTGTESRFGRYRKGDQTDAYIRKSLEKETIEGRVSLWAKKCPTLLHEVTIQGQKRNTTVSMHKDLELDIMQHMLNNGAWPRLNKSMK